MRDTTTTTLLQASIIWIIGEYAERIDNADEQLEHFLETFEEESAEVQLQLLTATVKLFLKQPEDTQVCEILCVVLGCTFAVCVHACLRKELRPHHGSGGNIRTELLSCPCVLLAVSGFCAPHELAWTRTSRSRVRTITL